MVQSDFVGKEANVIERQLRFFQQRGAGCLFAAVAAKDPKKYGWFHRILEPDVATIDAAIDSAIKDEAVTMISLLFPGVSEIGSFVAFLGILKRSENLFLESQENFADEKCFGFRCKVNQLRSYVTGFGDFEFLPQTRRAPSTELVIRVKPRPKYDFVFKEAPPGVIHLADLDMIDMPLGALQRLWDGSFTETKGRLGHSPDLRSAARTTYSIPLSILNGEL